MMLILENDKGWGYGHSGWQSWALNRSSGHDGGSMFLFRSWFVDKRSDAALYGSDMSTPTMMTFFGWQSCYGLRVLCSLQYGCAQVLNGEKDVVMTVVVREEISRWTWIHRSPIKLLVELRFEFSLFEVTELAWGSGEALVMVFESGEVREFVVEDNVSVVDLRAGNLRRRWCFDGGLG